MCTYGFTTRALVATVCDGDARRLVAMDARSPGRVVPGQSLTVSVWDTGDARSRFRTAVDGEVVLDRGNRGGHGGGRVRLSAQDAAA